ncbi:MAG TPA: NAD(P)-dependent oxidoreductase [Deltaproteobacteria bacterium]|jgi:3-hydroxyisobutyrate dehydrogenase-like beta-hydroxyacid dehydrogenase|nr:NAD(P)-dependent oxidoreductase [Deltaproteobacteria bacterium]
MTLRAGFIGLGNIGKPMARRLVKAGLETTVYDLAAAPVHELATAGAKGVATARAVGAASDYVGLCVRDDADLRAVTLGPDGVFAGAEAGTIIAVHSTVQPKTVLELSEVAAARGIGMIDACITGGAAGAAQGTLTVMVGGEAKHLDRIRPALESFARLIVHAGPLGAGAKLKLCNNLMTYLAWTSAYEATLLARAAGLPQHILEEVARSNGNLTDPMLAFLGVHKAPEETRRSETFQAMLAGFVELAEKDLAATLALARDCGVALPGAALASQIMARVYGLEDSKRR